MPSLKKLRFVFILFILFALQTVVFPCQGKSDVLAAETMKIGILEEPKTLNIWFATDAWSNRVLNLIYHPLYIRDPKTLKPVPWLAESDPQFDKEKLSYTVRLRQARWSDGSEFTADDVAFTGNIIRKFKIPRNYSQWKFIKDIEVVDKHTVRFVLARPEAIFLSRTLFTPIVQKKQWESIANEALRSPTPLARLHRHEVKTPVGTGPFILKNWRQGAYLFLEKNPHFFATGKSIAGYTLGPYIEGIILKAFGTTDAAVLALRKGSVDMFWWGIQPGYIEDLLENRNIRIFTNEKSALYYLAFNLREKPFNDAHFRRAVATLVDKEFIIKRVLQGYALKMQTIVPPGNTFWHCSDVPTYGTNLKMQERIRRAYDILRKAGYTWRVTPSGPEGKVVKGKGIILPDGSPMKKFTILTPPADYDPLRAMIGILIQEWLRKLGIPVTSRPMSFGALANRVKIRRQFDMFILGFGNLSLDPDYLRSFFHSSNNKPRGWNTSGYTNPEFDSLSDRSSQILNLENRRELILEMQRMLMRDLPFIPLYDPKLIEAVRTDRFSGWIEMLGGIGNTWSFCLLKPK